MDEVALKVKRLNLLCDEVIEERDIEKNLYDIEKELLEYQKPNVWNIHYEDNLERTLEVDFHKYAISVKEHVNFDLEKCTTFTFYASVEFIKEKHKPKH